MILRLWSCRWNAVRLVLAVFFAWVLGMDAARQTARMALAQLPDFDYAAEVGALRAQGRYGEALEIAESGLREVEGPARERLLAERKLVQDEQESWLRRAKDVGWGALSGQGETLESMIGAVAADFFIVGDVRDLAIQGTKAATGDDPDEVVLALSAVGVATTLAPEVDWAPSLMKVARRAGHMTDAFAGFIARAARSRNTAALRRVVDDAAALGRNMPPGAAMRAMKYADTPEDLAKLARFAEREKDAALALHVGGDAAAALAKSGDGAAHAAAMAAKKGRAGVRLVSSGAGRALTRVHPLVGLAKALWKGNAETLITRALDRLGASAWWVFPFAVAWGVVEVLLIGRKVRPRAAAVSKCPDKGAGGMQRVPAAGADRARGARAL